MSQGRRLKLSPQRKLIIEMLHHARKIPSIPVARTMNVGAPAAARARLASPPSWTALFVRAYGIVAQRVPEIRRAFIRWPWPHLYEHPFSVATVAVERDWGGERAVLAAKIRAPEEQPLTVLQQHLQHFKNAPLRSVSDFRQLMLQTRLPWLLRRFIFWQSLTWSGRKRAKRFGTFIVSSYGMLGAEQVHPISVLTTLLTYGPIGPTGEVVVKIIYDHRVTDGKIIAGALAELEEVMNHEIVQELASLESLAA
jgi:hypothetical protein